MKKIALIIPVFNGLSYTKECLTRLYELFSHIENPQASFQIVLVDDSSKDGTSEWVNSNFPQTHIVFGDGSLWWSGGINKGVKYAIDELKVDFILWWNNDILPEDDYFKNLTELIERNEAKTIYGSKIKYFDRKDRIWGFGGEFFTRKGNKHMLGTYEPDDERFAKEREVDWFAGMGTIFPVSVYSGVGYLDAKNFPQYHGDSDFTFRCKLAGYKLIVSPKLVIYNHTENTGNEHDNSWKQLFRSLKDIKSNYHLKKDILFYRKYATSPLAYSILVKKYSEYIFGFIKWKILEIFGIKRPDKQSRYMA